LEETPAGSAPDRGSILAKGPRRTCWLVRSGSPARSANSTTRTRERCPDHGHAPCAGVHRRPLKIVERAPASPLGSRRVAGGDRYHFCVWRGRLGAGGQSGDRINTDRGPAVRCKRFRRSWRCGLASMYPASDWSNVLPAIMDISAHAISLRDRPETGHVGYQCSHAPERPILHRRLILSQTSGRGSNGSAPMRNRIFLDAK
jgi:hypothetical protein